MNKKKLILLLAINSFFFFFVNIDVDIVNANQLIALWSWSIWCYMIYKLVFLLDYLSQNYLLKKNILLACLNYLLQIIFYILFVYIYVYDYLSINRDTILFLISINIVLELLLAFAMKSENKLYGVEEDKLNTDDIKEYILSRLIRQLKSSNDKTEEIRVISSILKGM